MCATNALELGVDVGSLDVTLHLGFPGTVASLWQQARCPSERMLLVPSVTLVGVICGCDATPGPASSAGGMTLIRASVEAWAEAQVALLNAAAKGKISTRSMACCRPAARGVGSRRRRRSTSPSTDRSTSTS